MFLIKLLFTIATVQISYQACTNKPGVSTCTNEVLKKTTPLRIENYQNLLEFQSSDLPTVPSGAFKLLTELKILYLTNSNIRSIDSGSFDGLYNLQQLSLYRNHLRTIPSNSFKDLRSLKILNLGSNEISTISNDGFVGLNNLEEINLSFNKLSTIPTALNTLVSLKKLILNYNMLGIIPSNSFNKLNRLNILEISDNTLNDIENQAFKGLSQVTELNLKSNYLSKLNVEDIARDLVSLKLIKLNVNSFKCSTLRDIDNVLIRKRISMERAGLNQPGPGFYNGIRCTM